MQTVPYSRMSLGLIILLTAANFRVFFAFPCESLQFWMHWRSHAYEPWWIVRRWLGSWLRRERKQALPRSSPCEGNLASRRLGSILTEPSMRSSLIVCIFLCYLLSETFSMSQKTCKREAMLIVSGLRPPTYHRRWESRKCRPTLTLVASWQLPQPERHSLDADSSRSKWQASEKLPQGPWSAPLLSELKRLLDETFNTSVCVWARIFDLSNSSTEIKGNWNSSPISGSVRCQAHRTFVASSIGERSSTFEQASDSAVLSSINNAAVGHGSRTALSRLAPNLARHEDFRNTACRRDMP